MDGDLAAADPNWVEIPPNETQWGDTFVIPPHEEPVPNRPGKFDEKPGHIGFVGYVPPSGKWKGGWMGISTNVEIKGKINPGWTGLPLEGFSTGGKPIRFFRWIGPIQPRKSSP